MRGLRIFVAVSLALFLPLAALAQTSTSNSQLAALMAEVTQLEQQIAALSASPSASASVSTPTPTTATTPTSSPVPNSYNGICPDLQENLSVGSSGTDVANLQAFLAGQGLFSGAITGYYGTITQTAVQEWQASRGIVTSGTPATTGFGSVGPETRAAITSMCGGGPTPQESCAPAFPPTTECPTTWQPVTDSAGCTEYYQCAIQLPTGASNTSTTASSNTTTTTSSSSQTCPVVQKPACNGTVEPFQTSASGCVESYECVL